jgi:hypothetical protein
MHGLENHTFQAMAVIKKLNSPLLNHGISKMFGYLERLDNTKARYLTGAFIAAKGVKSNPL